MLFDVYTGRIETIALNPWNADQILLGAQTGVLRTTDGGASWTRSDSGIHSVRANSIVQGGAGRLYVNGYVNGIHALHLDDEGLSIESADNGALREEQDDPWTLSLTALAVRSGDPDTLYAIVENDLYVSDNAGQDWERRAENVAAATVLDLKFASQSGSPVLLALSPGALHRSTNDGTSWDGPIAGLDFDLSALAVAPSNMSVAYLGGFEFDAGTQAPVPDSARVMKSSDGGATWQPTAALNTDFVAAIAIDPQDDRIVYVGSDVLLKSTNAGQSWQALSWNSEYEGVQAIAIDPQNSNIVYVANNFAIARSVDGGATWQTIPNFAQGGVEPARWRIASMAIDPSQPHRLFVGLRDQGVREISIEPELALGWGMMTGSVGRGVPRGLRFSVVNNGPFDATDVTTTIALPASAGEVTIETSGGNCVRNASTITCSHPIVRADEKIDIELEISFDAAGTFDVTATVAAAQPDSSMSNNTATVEVDVVARAELSVAIEGPTASTAGEALTYTATVTNAGPDDASDVVLDFEVASGLSIVTATPSQGSCEVEEETLVVCALGDLDADASATLTIVTSEASVGVYTQSASASSSTLDTISDNGALFTTNVTAQTDPGPGPDPDPTPDPDPSTNPPSNPPSNPPRSGGGGGGGSSSWLVLALLGLLGFAKHSMRARART